MDTDKKEETFTSSFLIFGCREEMGTDKKKETFISIFVLDIWL